MISSGVHIDVVYGIILSSVMCVAVAMAFMPRFPGVLIAYAGMWLSYLIGYTDYAYGTFLFWGVAVLIVLAMTMLLPDDVRKTDKGVGYMSGGGLVGMVVGMALCTMTGIILGSASGVFLGILAYSRTPKGRFLDFPTMKAVNYLCAKGLPIVVTFSIVGLVLSQLILYYFS